MKILISLLLFAVFLAPQSENLNINVKLLSSYRHNGKPNGNLWHNVLLPKNIKKDQLIGVAKALFEDRPGYYHFFIDDKEFQAFVDSDLHYLLSDKGNYPFPEKWFNKSCVAIINKHTSLGYLGQWALYAEGITGQKFADSTQDSFILNLGKPNKEIDN